MNSFWSIWPSIPLILGIVGGLVLLWGLFYWLLVITEGVYLGSWAVILGYDIVARKYDNIKEFNLEDEQILIADPVFGEIGDLHEPLLLDIASGTGRVPYYLFADGRFAKQNGHVISLDPSEKMLRLAQKKLADKAYPANLVRQMATPLPFADNTFDMVTCVEAMEFLPDQKAAMAEMCRVLKPGGTLMLTRRTGWESYMFFGRYYSREQFEAQLLNVGFTQAISFQWETIYDLVLAQKLD